MGGPGKVNDIEYNEFNNFFKCTIEYDGLTWTSSEQLYQALKFKDPNHRLKINKTTHIFDAYQLGHQCRELLIDNFEERKSELMFEANYAKFEQDACLRQILLSTDPHPIRFDGSTKYWNGKNAEIMMKIREILKHKF